MLGKLPDFLSPGKRMGDNSSVILALKFVSPSKSASPLTDTDSPASEESRTGMDHGRHVALRLLLLPLRRCFFLDEIVLMTIYSCPLEGRTQGDDCKPW